MNRLSPVPTVAPTEMSSNGYATYVAELMHWTDEKELHDAVRQGPKPMPPELVASLTPKLSPLTVTDPLPLNT